MPVADHLDCPVNRAPIGVRRPRPGAKRRYSMAGRNPGLLRLSLALLSPLVLFACGGGDGTPAVPDACAYVDLNSERSGTLPGSGSSYSIVTSPAKGSLTLTNPLTGEFTYTPNTNERGEDQFQFQVHGDDRSSNIATFRLVFTPRIMPLGDSITWGGSGDSSCPRHHVSYRKPLHEALQGRGFQVDFVGTLRSGQDAGLADADHEGHGGWTADQLVSGRSDGCTGSGNLTDWLNQTRPDVVLLHIGTNDLNGGGSIDNEWQDIEAIVSTINGWESGRWPVTIVLSRMIVNHERPPQDTTAYNDSVIENVARPHIQSGDQVIWVDHERALDSRSRYYEDTLHPNDAGYARMADVWLYPLTGSGLESGSHQGPGVLPKCP